MIKDLVDTLDQPKVKSYGLKRFTSSGSCKRKEPMDEADKNFEFGLLGNTGDDMKLWMGCVMYQWFCNDSSKMN